MFYVQIRTLGKYSFKLGHYLKYRYAAELCYAAHRQNAAFEVLDFNLFLGFIVPNQDIRRVSFNRERVPYMRKNLTTTLRRGRNRKTTLTTMICCRSRCKRFGKSARLRGTGEGGIRTLGENCSRSLQDINDVVIRLHSSKH